MVVALVAAAPASSACGDPCRDLEVEVCEELDDEERCALMEDPWRREHLSRSACEGILRSMARR